MLAASAPSSPPCDQHNNSKQVNLRRTSRRLQRSCRPSPIRHIHVEAMTKATPQPSSKSVTPQARRRCERTARGGAAPHRRWGPTPAPFVRTQSPPRPSAAALPPAAAVGVAARQRGLVVDGRGARGSRRCLQRPAHMTSHHLWLRHLFLLLFSSRFRSPAKARATEAKRDRSVHRPGKAVANSYEDIAKMTAKACAHLAAGDRADPSRRRQRPCRVRRAATVDFLAPHRGVGTAALGPPLRADNSAQPAVRTDFDQRLQA